MLVHNEKLKWRKGCWSVAVEDPHEVEIKEKRERKRMRKGVKEGESWGRQVCQERDEGCKSAASVSWLSLQEIILVNSTRDLRQIHCEIVCIFLGKPNF